jgi:hypothetical protein
MAKPRQDDHFEPVLRNAEVRDVTVPYITSGEPDDDLGNRPGDGLKSIVGLPDTRVEDSVFLLPSYGAILVKTGRLGDSTRNSPPTLIVTSGWKMPTDSWSRGGLEGVLSSQTALPDEAISLEGETSFELPPDIEIQGGTVVASAELPTHAVKAPPFWMEKILG